jgi:tetratricopeptide (TPR) repeat protein
MRREAAGETPFAGDELAFERRSLGVEQQPWLDLLYEGAMYSTTPDAAPQGAMVMPAWRELLESAVAAGRGANWLSWYHLGVMRHYAGERDAARAAWLSSLAHANTPWAQRNLAFQAAQEERFDEAADRYAAALAARPDSLPLAVECARSLIAAGRARDWLDLLDALPADVQRAGRLRLLEGEAALAAGDLERVRALFAAPLVIEDLREGERSLSHLWQAYHEHALSARAGVPIDEALRARVRREYPVPPELDFRMS